LSQNKTIQKQTANKHTSILVESFNQVRSFIHDQRGKLDKNSALQWTTVAKFLIRLRNNLINIKEQQY